MKLGTFIGYKFENIMNTIAKHLYMNKFSFWATAFGTVVYSFRHAFKHPSGLVRPEDLSNPNFVRPGEDFGFEVTVNAFGFILDVVRFYWSNVIWMVLIIAGATFIQKLWREKIRHIEV